GDPRQRGSDAWWVAQFNQVIRDAAKASGAKVADLEPDFRGHIADWTWYPSDVHPNNDGHAEIARLVWQALGFDQTPPSVRIERPATGPLARRTPTIRVKASDDVGVTAVHLYVDDSPTSDLLYVPSEDAYIGVWDARTYPRPTARLRVRATDLAGHAADAEVTVTLP
ncbi:MAG: lipolytic protein G-D-S-L, partial [Thermomicrobiaceae bacterium]|nr:lipolytic protein G-D-S-L [Thermomicrobiaceae bacterium]